MRCLVRTWALVALLALLAGGCTADEPVAMATMDAAVMRAEATPPPEDVVDVLVYYRHGRGADAYLTPVAHEVAVDDAQPRHALALLLEGPRRAEGQRLFPPLPPTTRLEGFSVRRGTAIVTLSHHAISDAKTVGKRPEHEALALAAVANTLTEFHDIRRVRLHVRSPREKEFWGFWGLPPLLVRDERAADPAHRESVSQLNGFSDGRQRVGYRRRSDPPRVAAIRVHPRATYTRVTVEVTAADGTGLTGPVPPSIAHRAGKGRIRFRVDGRPSQALAGALDKVADDPAFAGARVAVSGKPHRVVVTLRPHHRTDFWLHALSDPARVVLDIRR